MQRAGRSIFHQHPSVFPMCSSWKDDFDPKQSLSDITAGSHLGGSPADLKDPGNLLITEIQFSNFIQFLQSH